MTKHFIVQYRGKAIGFYQHEDMAWSVAEGYGERGSVVEAEGPCPTNAELDGLEPANDNYPRKAPRLRVVASKAALLASAKATPNPVFQARELRLVRGGK